MRKIWHLWFVLLVVVSWHCRRNRTDNETNANSRPNIIFFLADDMRYDALACNGNPYAITPNLDELAADGTNFKNSYVTSAICAISRASIFTGQYAQRHGITNFDKILSFNALQSTYPLVMRNHGYYTGFVGKYGVGTNLSLPASSFDYWKGFPGHGVYFYNDENGSPIHETALMGKQALEFLKDRDKSKPFCLSVSFKAPHSEDGVTENNGFRPDPYFDNWYTNVEFPLPETYSDSFYKQFSPLWRKSSKGVENEGRQRWGTRFSTPEKFQATYHAIYRLVSGVDKTIGELRDYLKITGLDKNTILVFSSDNGYYMGEHGLEGKWYGHEESIRVPLIIYDPRMPQQKLVDDMALNIDLAPTFLSWAGIKPPSQMQGKSLQPLLEGNDEHWRNEFFYEHPYDADGGTYIPKTVGVVTPTWKYMRYYTGHNSLNHILYEELFNVATDPHEKRNQIKDAAQQKRLETLRKKLAQYEHQMR